MNKWGGRQSGENQCHWKEQQQQKKKNERNEKISKRPLVHYKTYKHLYYRGSRGEERDKGPEKIFEEIID